MDCMVHGMAKSGTRLSNFHFHYIPTMKDEKEIKKKKIRLPLQQQKQEPLGINPPKETKDLHSEKL